VLPFALAGLSCFEEGRHNSDNKIISYMDSVPDLKIKFVCG